MPQSIVGSVTIALADSAKTQLPKISSPKRSIRNRRSIPYDVPEKNDRDSSIFPDTVENLPTGESFVSFYMIALAITLDSSYLGQLRLYKLLSIAVMYLWMGPLNHCLILFPTLHFTIYAEI